MRATHVCCQCGKIIEITKGLSHVFAMAGRNFCTWCYNSLYFSDKYNSEAAVPFEEFIRKADPRFIEDMLKKAVSEAPVSSRARG